MVGGYLDAFSYLAHGHVFANAQTGNVVLFSVYASGGEWSQAARHLLPIVAFILGVSAAWLLGVRAEKYSFRATLFCQCLELAMLPGLALFEERLPEGWIVPMISFVAALQSTSFSALGSWTFNNTMTTGNIRDATSGFVLWLLAANAPRTAEKRSCWPWCACLFC